MARPMTHVVHVLDSLAVGGTENGVVNLINASSGGFRHTVITVRVGGPLVDRLPPDVPVHCLGKRPGVDLRAVLRLVAMLRRLRPHVVHSRNWGAFDAVLSARLAGIRTVIHGEHGREASDPEGLHRRRNRLRRVLAPLVTRFVTVSVDLRHWLLATVGIPAEKVVTIHNGVDTDRFSEGDRADGRRALGVPGEAMVIGTVGRLDPVKDHVGLLAAFARLEGLDPLPTLLIVGDGPCRAALESEIGRRGLAGRVRLLGERRDVRTALHAFDVFVLSSRAEGISNTILEAMATGLPVVATEVGGNPELVRHDVTGLLVPAGDPQALAAALRTYSGDQQRRAFHGRAGRERALRDFGLDKMVQAYGRLYTSLCAGPRTLDGR